MADRDRGEATSRDVLTREQTERARLRSIDARRLDATEGDLLDQNVIVGEAADQDVADDERRRRLDAAHRREASEADLLADIEPAAQETEPAPARRP
jgi:hypothetical protein